MTARCDVAPPALVGGPAWFGVLPPVTMPGGRGTVPGSVRLPVAARTATPDQAGAAPAPAPAPVATIADGTPDLAATDKPGAVPMRGIAAASAAARAASVAPT